MVRAAGGVEARVGPVAEVADDPRGGAVLEPGAGLVRVGAGEGFEEEVVYFFQGGLDSAAEGGDLVVAVLVVGVAVERGLSRCQ